MHTRPCVAEAGLAHHQVGGVTRPRGGRVDVAEDESRPGRRGDEVDKLRRLLVPGRVGVGPEVGGHDPERPPGDTDLDRGPPADDLHPDADDVHGEQVRVGAGPRVRDRDRGVTAPREDHGAVPERDRAGARDRHGAAEPVRSGRHLVGAAHAAQVGGEQPDEAVLHDRRAVNRGEGRPDDGLLRGDHVRPGARDLLHRPVETGRTSDCGIYRQAAAAGPSVLAARGGEDCGPPRGRRWAS